MDTDMLDAHHIRDASDALFSHRKTPRAAVYFTTAAGLLMLTLVSTAIVLTNGVPGNTPGGVYASAPAQTAKAG